jgi:CheY-like chemotaxis protein
VRERREGDYTRAELRQGLEVIARNSKLQAQLIEDILDVSRIIAGKLRVDLRPVDVEPILRQAIESIRPSAEARGIALSLSIEPGGVVVLGDAARLTQVVSNLLNNSVKFTPAGGAVDVLATADAEWGRIVVRDTGRGIAQRDLTRVFERFQQVDGSTTRTARGLGLGLAIVDHIVRAHGGEVVASSPGLGLGSSFAIRLRRSAMENVAPPPTHVAAVGDDGELLLGCRVLCVDDDADALELMSLVLEQRGAQVKTASTAADALAMIAAATPDIVISDIGLPEEDGFALMHRIRALPGDASRVPVIALTGYAGALAAGRAIEAGFRQFVSKPVTPDVLARVVARVIAQQKLGSAVTF